MADNPIADYQEARRNFAAAKAHAEEVCKVVTDAGQVLRNWPWVGISNKADANFPTGSKWYIDATKWPRIDDLTKSMQLAHEAHWALQNAWERIPAQDREGLQSPPVLRDPNAR